MSTSDQVVSRPPRRIKPTMHSTSNLEAGTLSNRGTDCEDDRVLQPATVTGMAPSFLLECAAPRVSHAINPTMPVDAGPGPRA